MPVALGVQCKYLWSIHMIFSAFFTVRWSVLQLEMAKFHKHALIHLLRIAWRAVEWSQIPVAPQCICCGVVDAAPGLDWMWSCFPVWWRGMIVLKDLMSMTSIRTYVSFFCLVGWGQYRRWWWWHHLFSIWHGMWTAGGPVGGRGGSWCPSWWAYLRTSWWGQTLKTSSAHGLFELIVLSTD